MCKNIPNVSPWLPGWLVFCLCVVWGVWASDHLYAQTAKGSPGARQIIRIVLDAGHGGHDPGTERSRPELSHEKDIALKIILLLGSYIEDNIDNIEVLYIRKKDVFVNLENRVIMANSAKADFYLSVHCNSNPNPAVKGTQTHIHDHSFQRSRRLAQFVNEEFKSRAKRESRGIFNAKDRRHNLYVLKNTTMPGVLIEAGFMSNPNEELFLNSPDGQDIMASAIYRALKNFLLSEGYHLEFKTGNPPVLSSADEASPKVYKVQISASPTRIPLSHEQFRKLKVKVEEHINKTPGVTYKYTYTVGEGSDLDTAKALLEQVRKSGFKDAFITRAGQ